MIAFTTVTGRRLNLGMPRVRDIHIEDVATGLSNMCRYTGQVELFYSVAQHACLVAQVVNPSLAYPALHHDDPEAYLGDVASKLKHHPEMAWFRGLEDLWAGVVEQAMGIDMLRPNERREIKAADDLVAVFERVAFRYRRPFKISDIQQALDDQWVTASTHSDMLALTPRLPQVIPYMEPRMAKVRYLAHHVSLRAHWRYPK